MNTRRTLQVFGVGVGGVVLGLTLSSRGGAQEQQSALGRYQLAAGTYFVVAEGKPTTGEGLFRLDTATGEVVEIYSMTTNGLPQQRSRPFFK